MRVFRFGWIYLFFFTVKYLLGFLLLSLFILSCGKSLYLLTEMLKFYFWFRQCNIRPVRPKVLGWLNSTSLSKVRTFKVLLSGYTVLQKVTVRAALFKWNWVTWLEKELFGSGASSISEFEPIAIYLFIPLLNYTVGKQQCLLVRPLLPLINSHSSSNGINIFILSFELVGGNVSALLRAL